MLVFFHVGICKYFLEHARHCLSRNVNVTHEQGTKTKVQLNRTRIKIHKERKVYFKQIWNLMGFSRILDFPVVKAIWVLINLLH